MQTYYSSIQGEVPSSLTAPSKSFKKHVALAMMALIGFVVVYLGLMIWFAILSYQMMGIALNQHGGFWQGLLSVFMGFLSLFMLKSLFIFTKRDKNEQEPLSPKSQPVLFDFIHRLADEAGAPRPVKVYLTHDVNASVFYSLSLLNLVFPSRKNLTIGLGLVNVLNLGEFKAVLAHEFGHFAQRSMLLGRYVYTAQQIAERIVYHRDIIDEFLAGLSVVDFRLAWIGWIASVLVWAVRSLISSLFYVVTIAERALSREMEFQADLVAVSMTGSDAIVNALHRLGPADSALQLALQTADHFLSEEKVILNLYEIQSYHLQRLRETSGDAQFGLSPAPEDLGPEVRIFAGGAINPPQMWSSHPSNEDREANAKRTYVPATIDDRSAWHLFLNPEETQSRVTASLFSHIKVDLKEVPTEEALEWVEQEYYQWSTNDPKYRGLYRHYIPFRNFKELDEAYAAPIEGKDLTALLQARYPESLSEDGKRLRELSDEVLMLEHTMEEDISLSSRKLSHHGQPIKRADIPGIIAGLQEEIDVLRDRIRAHEQLARTTALAAAMQLPDSDADALEGYLLSLGALVHYTVHQKAYLERRWELLMGTVHLALTHFGNPSTKTNTMQTLFLYASELRRELDTTLASKETIHLDERIRKKLMGKSYSEVLPNIETQACTRENVNQWINAASRWVQECQDALVRVSRAAYSTLLEVEEELIHDYLHQRPSTLIPAPLGVMTDYPTAPAHPKPKKLPTPPVLSQLMYGQTAGPVMARFSIAALLIFGSIFFAFFSSSTTVKLLNGLGIPVVVEVDGDSYEVPATGYTDVSVRQGRNYHFTVRDRKGNLIEEEDHMFEEAAATYIYNIAHGAQLGIYYAGYGVTSVPDPEIIGSPKWFMAETDYVLEEPPERIKTVSSETKSVLYHLSEFGPSEMPGFSTEDPDNARMALSHATWDPENANHTLMWIGLAGDPDPGLGFLRKRRELYPDDFSALLVLYQYSDSTVQDSLCGLHGAGGLLSPESGDAAYMTQLCDQDSSHEVFIALYKEWPDHPWITAAAGKRYYALGKIDSAYQAFRKLPETSSALAQALSDDYHRCKNYMEGTTGEPMAHHVFYDNLSGIMAWRAIESGDEAYFEGYDDLGLAWTKLHQGKYEAAWELATPFEASFPTVQLAVATSTNTGPVNRMLARKVRSGSGVNPDNIYMAMAFYLDEPAHMDSLLADFATYELAEEEDVQSLPDYLDMLRKEDLLGANAYLEQMEETFHKHQLQMIGVIRLGNSAPLKWKQAAQYLLLPMEKPRLELEMETISEMP